MSISPPPGHLPSWGSSQKAGQAPVAPFSLAWISRHQKDGKYNAENRHAVLPPVDLCGNRDQAKIAFHSKPPSFPYPVCLSFADSLRASPARPKSVTTPSDTCRILSAVWAMRRLWVIMIIVCSYFLEVSFRRAMTCHFQIYQSLSVRND